MRTPLLGLLGMALLAGCPDHTVSLGANNDVVTGAPPYDLTYSENPAVYIQGQPIVNDVPSSFGGRVSIYVLGSALPAGLTFSNATGIVSGTPTVASPTTGYTITASNAHGSTRATLTITVITVAAGLSYATNPAVYSVGQQITPDVPTLTGLTATSWTVYPALPAGLSFSATTGIVSGTPTLISAASAYTVTATGPGGSASVALSIAVNALPPTGLTYAPDPAIDTVGVLSVPDVPSFSGGTPVSWAITPTLPYGLDLDPTTGIISGTPSVPAAATVYTVTATSSGGSTTGTVTLTVNPAPPSALTYSPDPALDTVGVLSVPDFPTYSGGTSDSWAIAPPLPAGLSLDTTTGIISGTPSVVAAATVYTVTATNAGGSTTGTLTLTVAAAPPPTLTYAPNPAVDTVNVLSVPDVPTFSGATPAAWAIAPPLPTGLQLNGTTGIISGTPTVLSAATVYTVTATNTAGATTGTLTLSVIAATGTTLQPGTLAVGGEHACVIVNGGVECWGYNLFGELGNNSAVNSSVPVTVPSLTGVQSLAAGEYHTCAIVNGGGVQCWGWNSYGELGNNSTVNSGVPVQVFGLTSGAQVIAADYADTCAVVNGGVQCWGSNQFGEIGGNAPQKNVVPIPISGLSNVQDITVGSAHACALSGGAVQCWGEIGFYPDVHAQGDMTITAQPVTVAGLTGSAQSIAAGGYTTCAVVSGEGECWGSNQNAQLGNSSAPNGSASALPVLKGGAPLTGVQAFTGGDAVTCAIVNGDALCWGGYFTGSGTAPWDTLVVPEAVPNLPSGVTAIGAGNGFECALANGGAWCWGIGAYGQLGNDSTVNTTAAVSVVGLSSGL